MLMTKMNIASGSEWLNTLKIWITFLTLFGVVWQLNYHSNTFIAYILYISFSIDLNKMNVKIAACISYHWFVYHLQFIQGFKKMGGGSTFKFDFRSGFPYDFGFQRRVLLSKCVIFTKFWQTLLTSS
jgi:hypothetical protein